MDVIQELLDLGDGGDPELLIDLIEMFLEDSPQKMAAIGEGLETGDWEMVERAAHSLKGSSGNLGAIRLQAYAELFQLASREEGPEKLLGEFDELRERFTEARQALHDILSEHR
jgi:HPt (histidine-containing phosphotransfer) domain-containing protein